MAYRSLPTTIYERLSKRRPYSLGFSKYALDFSMDGYVEVPDSPSISPTSEVSVACWVKATVPVDYSTSWVWKGGYNFTLYCEGDGIPRFYVWDTAGNSSHAIANTQLATNEWVFLVGTLGTDKRARLYVNGVLQDTIGAVIADIRDQAGNLLIGKRGDGIGESFDGIINEVLGYNRGLSQNEIQYTMLNYHNPIRNGLVLWLPFEEGVGTTVYDGSGYGNNGTLHGATWDKVKMWELRAEVGL